MDDQTLYRAAGISAGIAVATFIISAIALGLFFGGAGAFWGPVNDVSIAATGLALLLPILAIDRMAGGDASWLRAVTIIGIVGALVMAIGQLLLGFSWSLPTLFLARVWSGAATGNIAVAQAYIADVTTPENRARGMGIIGVAFGLGFIIGPATGGLVSELVARRAGWESGYQAAFAVAGASVILCVALALPFLLRLVRAGRTT